MAQGNPASAQSMLEDAIRLYESSGPRQLDVGFAKLNLAKLLFARGQIAKSRSVAGDALVALRETLGEQHRWTRDAQKFVEQLWQSGR